MKIKSNNASEFASLTLIAESSAEEFQIKALADHLGSVGVKVMEFDRRESLEHDDFCVGMTVFLEGEDK